MKKLNLTKETEMNIRSLIAIRDNVETQPAVRIQAIQTLQKIMTEMGSSASDNRPTEADIMKKIRSSKK